MPPQEEEEEEEEDYMSMVIEEPKQKETFTQKKLRQQREVSFIPYLHTQIYGKYKLQKPTNTIYREK